MSSPFEVKFLAKLAITRSSEMSNFLRVVILEVDMMKLY